MLMQSMAFLSNDGMVVNKSRMAFNLGKKEKPKRIVNNDLLKFAAGTFSNEKEMATK